MKLTAPICRLKRHAKQLARQEAIPLVSALNRVAADEGFKSWSLLATQYASASPAAKLYGRLNPGDLLLLGARPGQGKTMLALELAVRAAKIGRHSTFFSLEFTEQDVLERMAELGFDYNSLCSRFTVDCSDAICADYMIGKMQAAPQGSFIVVDYLQLLDHRRDFPPLARQVEALRAFAGERGMVIVCTAQIQRTFRPAEKPLPDLGDVRMPNPLDLTLFNKTCFLHNGVIALQSAH
jgi:replicative DNA helicase